jgi:hypothetical protein
MEVCVADGKGYADYRSAHSVLVQKDQKEQIARRRKHFGGR